MTTMTATELGMMLYAPGFSEPDKNIARHIQFAHAYRVSGIPPSEIFDVCVDQHIASKYNFQFVGKMAVSLLIAYREDEKSESWKHLESIRQLSDAFVVAPDTIATKIFQVLNHSQILTFWHQAIAHSIDLRALIPGLQLTQIKSLFSCYGHIEPVDIAQQSLARLLLTDRTSAESFVRQILESCLKILFNDHTYARPQEEYRLSFEKIDNAFQHVAVALPLVNPSSLSDLVSSAVATYSIVYPRQNETPLHSNSHAIPLLWHFLEHLDRIGIPWQRAMADKLGKTHANHPPRQLLKAACLNLAKRDTISNTEFLIDTVVIQQASVADILRLFSDHTDLQAVIYEVRQDQELLTLMQPHERRKSLGFDMDI